MAESPDVSYLLEQSSWLRALARRLVADPDRADDLVQDTWVRALEARPRTDLPVRGWVATVLRNGAARTLRRDADRAHREQVAARDGATPSAHEVVERASLHRDVVQAVLALEEPYRTAILLRFFEQRSYAEIARQTGTTKATVNSRITRGLERLRRRLDGAYGGDRRAWVVALGPLCGEPGLFDLVRHGVAQASATLQGAPLMYAVLATATAAAVVTTVSLWAPAEAPGAAAARPLRAAPATAAAAPAELVPPPVAPRAQVDEAAPAPAAPADPAPVATSAPAGERWKTEIFHSAYLAPETVALEISSGAGDVEVLESTDGMLRVEGEVAVETRHVSSGQLTRNFLDHVELDESGGKLRLRDRHEGSNENWSVDLTVYVPKALAVSAASGAGDVEIHHGAGTITASSGAGDVEVLLGDVEASITASSGAGSVEIEVGALKGDLRATSGAGDVEVTAGRAEPGKYVLTSGAGDVELTLPRGLTGTFDLQTSAGELEIPDELGLKVEEFGGAGARVRGSNGTGFDIKMRSGAGDVEIQLTERDAKPI